MNAIELIHLIFDGVEGDVVLYSATDENTYTLDTLPDPLPADIDGLDLRVDGLVYAVEIPSEEGATVSLYKEGETPVHLAVLENAAEEADVPDFVQVFDIPLQAGWEAVEGTGKLYEFEEVFGNEESAVADAPGTVAEDGHDGPEDDGDVRGGPETDTSGAEAAREPVHEGASGDADGDDGGSADAEEGREVSASGPGPEEGAVSRGAASLDPSGELNDADIIGDDPEGIEDFLNRPVTFLVGEMWGQRDRRNTQDGKWLPTELPLGAWIGGQAGTKTTPTWGFSRHPEAKDKAGPCIVLGSSVDGARKAKAMDTMYAMGLDIDSGAKLDDVMKKVRDRDLLCFVYTTFSHGKSGLELKRDEVLRKLKITRDPEISEIRHYLKEHDKNRFENDFIAKCQIAEQKHQTSEGVKIILDTPPLEKFRLIFPLAEPVKLIDLEDTQQGALDLWEDKVTGLARNVLGVHFDAACTDPSRLFYTARHPKGADNWYSAILMGNPLSFDDIDEFKKSAYVSNREVNAFTEAGGTDEEEARPPQCLTPNGKSLNDWHRRYKDRFMLADLMETLCSDKIRIAGGEAQGHVHTECPFEHEHSEEGGTATMAINSVDSQNEYWTWFCHHDSCQGRHKLEFLEEALRQGWFDEDALVDEDSGFALAGADEPEEEEEDEPEEEPVADGVPLTFEEQAAQFTPESTEEDIIKLFKKIMREGEDNKPTRANVTTAIARNTNLGKRDITGYWSQLDAERAERDRKKTESDKTEGSVAEANRWDFDEIMEYAKRRLLDTNREKPKLFHYMDNLYTIVDNAEGHAKLKELNMGGFENHLNKVAKFVQVSGDDASRRGVPADPAIVRNLYNDDYSVYPALRGLITSPTFTKDGSLLTKEGYDWNSRLFYQPKNDLFIPNVSPEPTSEELFRAKQLLVEEVLADFPLGALTRPEIVDKALYGEGVAAVTNIMAMILLPFMREMIDGATPGHLLVKPAPGTGASLLTDVCSIIANGMATPAMTMPNSNEEMSKTLTTVLADGCPTVFFDNINHSVDSGELASAMTAPIYQARRLGATQRVEVEVRCTWVFTGNNVTLSSELIRRLIMIDLDAQLESPEKRTDFRHSNLPQWCKENRGELVWACLTIIQNWVAQGMVPQTDVMLASYEPWAGVVGGVLKAAGFGDFMGNREALKANSSDGDSDDFLMLLEAWWDTYGIKEVTTNGDGEQDDGLIGLAASKDLSLPVRKDFNNDGERVYNSRGFGIYLGKFRGQVKSLECGTQVKIMRSEKRSRRGSRWHLSLVDGIPESNIEVAP